MNITVFLLIPGGLACFGIIAKSITKCISQIKITKMICEHPELSENKVKHLTHGF